MKPVVEILKDLRATRSKKEKEAILAQNSTNDVWRSVLKWSLDPYTRFYIRKVSTNPLSNGTRTIESNFSGLASLLGSLSRREITGHRARDAVEAFISELDLDNQDVVVKILHKDLDCGVATTTANNVYGENFIETFDLMLATPWKAAKVKFPAAQEPKMDGLRCCVRYDGTDVEYLSRSGMNFDTLYFFDELVIELLGGKPGVLDCEVMSATFNDTASGVKRKTANDKTLTSRLHVFEYLTLEEFDNMDVKLNYEQRRARLEALFSSMNPAIESDRIVLVPMQIVKDEDEAFALFGKHLEDGFEGSMVKDLSGLYEFKRSKKIGKLKPEETVDVEVVGYYEGKSGKNIGRFGGFIVLIDGVETSVGGGYSDKQRDDFWEIRNQTIGWIIEVTYMEKTDSRAGGGKMRHSRFKKVRSMKGAKV